VVGRHDGAVKTTWLLALVLGAGCREGTEQCTLASARLALTSGVEVAEYLGTSAAQRAAVGRLEIDSGQAPRSSCTAVAIHPNWAISAKHCMDPTGTPLWLSLEGTRTPIDPALVITHPVKDLVLLPLTTPAAGYLPIDTSDAGGAGQWVEVAGAGLDENGLLGGVTFGVTRIDHLDESVIATAPVGARPCFGDSGGPLLARSHTDGRVRVLGILSEGAPQCTGGDIYERLEPEAEWIDSITKDRPVALESACEALGSAGRCFGTLAVWCDGAERAENCGSATACGWDEAARGFRCLAPDRDACSGFSDIGDCLDNHAVRCVDGELKALSCDACGAACEHSASTGRAQCARSEG
jgi:Trypsin